MNLFLVEQLRLLSRTLSNCGMWMCSNGLHRTPPSDSGTVVYKNYSVLPCQYHSSNGPYSFVHLPLTLCNVRHSYIHTASEFDIKNTQITQLLWISMMMMMMMVTISMTTTYFS